MKYAFFHIPALDPSVAQEELNRFLAQHRVHNVSREFVNDTKRSSWCLCVQYDEGEASGKVAGGGGSGRPARIDSQTTDACCAVAAGTTTACTCAPTTATTTSPATATTTWASAWPQLTGSDLPLTSRRSGPGTAVLGEAKERIE